MLNKVNVTYGIFHCMQKNWNDFTICLRHIVLMSLLYLVYTNYKTYINTYIKHIVNIKHLKHLIDLIGLFTQLIDCS